MVREIRFWMPFRGLPAPMRGSSPTPEGRGTVLRALHSGISPALPGNTLRQQSVRALALSQLDSHPNGATRNRTLSYRVGADLVTMTFTPVLR